MPRRSTPRPRDADATKSAILDAARARFASEGFENATIRLIASDAGVDPALVVRYFGGKDKLFAAAADFDLRLPDLSAIPRSKIGATLAGNLVDRWERDDTFMALLRAAATNDAAAKRVRSVLASQVTPAIAPFVPARTGAAVPAKTNVVVPARTNAAVGDDIARRGALVGSQLLGFALGRYILGFAPLHAMTRDEIVDALGPTLQRYITGAL